MVNNRLTSKSHSILTVLYDIGVIIFSLFLAFLLRHDFQIPTEIFTSLGLYLLWALPVKLFVFYFFGLYRGMYRYTSIWDLVTVVKATIISALL